MDQRTIQYGFARFFLRLTRFLGFEAEFYDPKATVIGFVFDTVKLRGENNLNIYVSHVIEVLQRFVFFFSRSS